MKHLIKTIIYDVTISFRSHFGMSFSACFFIFLIWLAIYSYLRKKNNVTSKPDYKKIIFSFMLLGCYFMIFFETIYSRPAHSRESLSLIFHVDSGRYLLENILLFIPEGFIWTGVFVKNKRFLKVTTISFFSSLAIETTQLMTGRGYFQICDLLTNTAGGVAGSILYAVLLFLFTHLFNNEKNKT